MIDKNDLQELLDPATSDSRRQELMNAVQQNSDLAGEYQSLLQVRSTLKRCCPGVPDSDLWKSCQSRLNQIDASRKAERVVSKWQFAFSGGLLVFIIGMGLMNRSTPARGNVRAAEVPAMMSGLVPGFNRGESPQSAMERRMPDAPVTIPVDQMAITGFYESRNGASPVYRLDLADRLGNFSLVAFPDCATIEGSAATPDGRYRVGMIFGQNYVSWSSRGYAFMAVGQRDILQLQAVVDRIRSDR